MNNPILGPDNKFFTALAPADAKVIRNTLDGVPLGVTASGELGVKVIVIGNATVGIASLPTVPGASGTIWNDNGTPRLVP